MTFIQKPGQGSLFSNQRKTQDNHPDYTGSINIDGNEYQLAGWKKTGQKGGSFLSLSAKIKIEKPTVNPIAHNTPPAFEDEIPF